MPLRSTSPILPLALLAACAIAATARGDERSHPGENLQANAPMTLGQPASEVTSRQEQQRLRLPPVMLAQHTQPLEQSRVASVETSLSAPLPRASQPRRLSGPEDSPENTSARGLDAGSSLVTVGTSLTVVLGLFFAMALLLRRNMPKSAQAPPGEVLEVLGRAPLPGKQQLQVVRFGSKLVLLSVTADGVEPVSEITEPDEVQQLTALCRRESPGSSAQAFQEILNQMGREPAKGFLGSPSAGPKLSRR